MYLICFLFSTSNTLRKISLSKYWLRLTTIYNSWLLSWLALQFLPALAAVDNSVLFYGLFSGYPNKTKQFLIEEFIKKTSWTTWGNKKIHTEIFVFNEPAACSNNAAIGQVGMTTQVALGLHNIAVTYLEAVALTPNLSMCEIHVRGQLYVIKNSIQICPVHLGLVAWCMKT